MRGIIRTREGLKGKVRREKEEGEERETIKGMNGVVRGIIRTKEDSNGKVRRGKRELKIGARGNIRTWEMKREVETKGSEEERG